MSRLRERGMPKTVGSSVERQSILRRLRHGITSKGASIMSYPNLQSKPKLANTISHNLDDYCENIGIFLLIIAFLHFCYTIFSYIAL